MPLKGRRRGAVQEDDETAPTQTQRNVQRDTPDNNEDVDVDGTLDDRGSGSISQLSKGLVRYALACEHSRKPIKRQDVNEKVLGTHSRLFGEVFASANSQLVEVFGMQLVELAKPDRVTTKQKRAAAASESQSKTSTIWVLQNMLPEEYRAPDIIGPSRPLPDDDVNREDSYVALYTMTIALIAIAGGRISEGQLDRQQRRMNVDRNTPLGTKDKTIAAMIKDGYVVKVKDTHAEEDMFDYIVGPRGKVEVGREGVAQLIRLMYGEDEDQETLERKMQRTLDVADTLTSAGLAGLAGLAGDASTHAASQPAARKRGRPRDDEDDV